MSRLERPLYWIGGSRKDLLQLPVGIRKAFGYALHYAQSGEQHPAAKVLRGFDGAGILEVVENDQGGTYRAVYTVRFEEAVFVLHCFQKKSKRGIATHNAEIEIIRARLRVATQVVKEMRDVEARR